jgi:peroxiredoxin-like protein
MNEHHFQLTAQWNGGIQGEGKITCQNLESPISIPKQLSGPGKGTNPEELLLGAAGTCYLITLAAILERRHVPVENLALTSQITVTQEGPALKVTQIVHSPTVTLKAEATETHRDAAKEAAERAEKVCMISNALRTNVEFAVKATVI